jgi:hypothetical protein
VVSHRPVFSLFFFFISPPPPLAAAGSQSAGKPRPFGFPVGRLTRASRNAARIDALDVSFFTLCHAYATKERHLEFPSKVSGCGQPIGCRPTAEGARVFSKIARCQQENQLRRL